MSLRHWLHRVTRRVEHAVKREVRQQEHLAKRALYYTANEAPYVVAAGAFVGSYFGGPLVGGAVAALGGEAERWGEYYALRENSHHGGQKYTTWEARKRARKFADRTWEYGAAAAGAGGLASFATGLTGFSASIGSTAAPTAESQAALNAGTLEAQGLGPTSVDLTPEEYASSLGHGSYTSLAPTTFNTGNGGFLGSAWNTVSSLPTLAYENPAATLGILSTGYGVAQKLEPQWFGQTGQQIQYGITTAYDLGNALNGLGSAGAGAGGGPGIGGGADLGIDWGTGASATSNIPMEYVVVGALLILAVVLLG